MQPKILKCNPKSLNAPKILKCRDHPPAFKDFGVAFKDFSCTFQGQTYQKQLCSTQKVHEKSLVADPNPLHLRISHVLFSAKPAKNRFATPKST